MGKVALQGYAVTNHENVQTLTILVLFPHVERLEFLANLGLASTPVTSVRSPREREERWNEPIQLLVLGQF